MQNLLTLSYESDRSLLGTLKKRTASEVLPLPNPGVLSVPSTSAVDAATSILLTSKIHGAPLWFEETSSFGPFLDAKDVLHHLITTFAGKEWTVERGTERYQRQSLLTPNQWTLLTKDEDALKFKAHVFSNQNIASIIVPKAEDPPPIPLSSPLYQLLYNLTNGKRCSVFDPLSPLGSWWVVSQSDIIKFLAKQIIKCDFKDRYQTIEDMKLGTKWDFDLVVKASSSLPAIEAFYRMYHYNIPTMPILNDEKGGIVLANLSITDVLYVNEQNFKYLLRPLDEWMPAMIPNLTIPPITIHYKTTFENLLLLFASTGLHHIWVTGETAEVRRVVSLGDVIGRMYELLEGLSWKEQLSPK